MPIIRRATRIICPKVQINCGITVFFRGWGWWGWWGWWGGGVGEGEGRGGGGKRCLILHNNSLVCNLITYHGASKYST